MEADIGRRPSEPPQGLPAAADGGGRDGDQAGGSGGQGLREAGDRRTAAPLLLVWLLVLLSPLLYDLMRWLRALLH